MTSSSSYESPDKVFIFEWDIEDFSMCCRSLRGPLDSPVFRITILQESNWFLRLFPRSFDERPIRCLLCRCQDENIPKESRFGATVEIVTPMLVPDVYQTRPCVDLNKWLTDVHFVNLGFTCDIPDWNSLLWKGVLKLKCTVWNLDRGSPNPNNEYLPTQPTSFAWEDMTSVSSSEEDGKDFQVCRPFHSKTRSKVDVVERTLTWTMKNFLRRKNGDKLSLCLRSALGDTCSLLLSVYICSKPASYGTLMVDFRWDTADTKKVFLIKCRISVVDPEGVVESITPEMTHHFDGFSLERTIPTDLTSDNLIWGKPRLNRGELKLRFEIALSRGGCEHIAGSALGTRRPTNQIRVFQIEMLRMYKDRLHCDATLRAPDGQTFEVHRTVLSSRSIVFAMWFTDRESDVFDVPDVDSVTLDRLLSFMYAAVLEDLGLDDLLKVYSASSLYGVLLLQQLSKYRIYWMLNAQTVAAIQEVVEIHDMDFANFIDVFATNCVTASNDDSIRKW